MNNTITTFNEKIIIFEKNLEEIKKLISESISITEAKEKIKNIVNVPKNSHFHSLVKMFNIDISHFKGHGWNKGLCGKTNEKLRLAQEKAKLTKIKNGTTNVKSFLGKHHSEDAKKRITKGRIKYLHGNEKIISIKQLTGKTITKIFQKMNIGCSYCGWNKSTCDIHHINGKKIENANMHENLCYLCPNCHRLVHRHLIKKEDLISLDKQFEQLNIDWKKYYYCDI